MDLAGPVTITRPDGTVTTQPAYGPADLFHIIIGRPLGARPKPKPTPKRAEPPGTQRPLRTAPQHHHGVCALPGCDRGWVKHPKAPRQSYCSRQCWVADHKQRTAADRTNGRQPTKPR